MTGDILAVFIANDLKIKVKSHPIMSHLVMLVIICAKYEKNPSRTMGTTEPTKAIIDIQTKSSIPPY